MSKCSKCGNELLTGDSHWELGWCNNCYNELYKVSNLEARLAESESKRKSSEEKLKFLTEEIKECFVDGQKYNELREQKDKEIQQLKQQLHDLPKKIVEEIKIEMGSIEDILINCGNGKEDALSWFNKILDTILKKYGEEDE